jgi:hypothetical protein
MVEELLVQLVKTRMAEMEIGPGDAMQRLHVHATPEN